MNKVILDILEFNIAFIKYTNKCAPENEKLNSINHILNFSVQILSTFNIQSFFKAEIDKVCELLSVPLESIYSLFDMPNFPQLLLFLDYSNMKKIGLKIINNLINPNSKEVIDSLDKIHKLFGFIQPLLRNIQSVEEENDPNFEVEQNTVAKLLFVIRCQDPEVLLGIYNELKNVLYEGGKKRRVIIFPALANILIYFCQNLSALYENKDNEEKKENSFDISKLESDDDFYEFMSKIYQLLTDTIKVIEEDFPLMALKLNLLTACQIDIIKPNREKFQETCVSFFDNSLNIYNNLDKEKRFEIFTDICQKLLQITIISQENLEKYFTQFLAEVKSMPTRTDQCVGYLIMSQMYFTHFKEGKKVLDCLSKAKKIADFSLTNPRNLILYIYLLNKYIYYIDVDTENIVEIDNEYIEDLIEAIKNHMITIKTDKNIDACFLPEIEKYFKNTLNLITERKSEEEHKQIYDKINIDSE
jgi:vacuolar protein sorting-associated protein 35